MTALFSESVAWIAHIVKASAPAKTRIATVTAMFGSIDSRPGESGR